MPKQGPRPGSKLTVAELELQGPRLHRYPNGLYVIQFVGLNKRKRRTALAKKIGMLSPEMAEQYLETFKIRYAANNNSEGNGAHVPAVLTIKQIRARAAEPSPHRPRDTTKAVLGLIATHLLNTMAHTVKLLQEADAD